MTFADLQAGDSVFVDANTLIYHCTLDPAYGSACADLLDQIGRGVITGFTSTHMLSEVAHRLMALEASRLLVGRRPVWPITSRGTPLKFNAYPAFGKPSRTCPSAVCGF